jgi:hypothetical protein
VRRVAGRRAALPIVRRFHLFVVVCDQHLQDVDWRDLLRDLQAAAGPPIEVRAHRAGAVRLHRSHLEFRLLLRPAGGDE